MDTIFAPATAPGRSGVSVIRVSGPDAFVVCRHLTGSVPRARVASLRQVRRADGEILDRALVLIFPGPESFTGEDVVELHLHGSTAILAAVEAEIGTLPGCRHADAGEFTRRALQNGKMDLTEVEGLADLIDAQTEAQRQQAQAVASGRLRLLVEDLRAWLTRSAALLEAVIDFADEEVPEDVSDDVVQLLDNVLVVLRREIDGQKFAERVRRGFEVAIVGAPNSGKSTLLNGLAGREVAITSVHAGTTRDVIEVQMDLGGIPVTVLDLAGLREAEDPVERIGVERAYERARAADIRVFLLSPGETPQLELQPGDVPLIGKADLLGDPEDGVSGLTGFGIDRLVAKLEREFKSRVRKVGVATRERHLQAFVKAEENLCLARDFVLGGPSEYDIAAEEIRTAMRSLDIVIGRIGVEDLLDEIFASFCVGK